jgi:transcriptional regulator with XRE-family HTH domain
MTDGERDPAEFGDWPLGTRLKALRTEARLSLRAVANAAGTTAATVDAMEKGYRMGHDGDYIAARSPRAETVMRVAEAVGLNAAEALKLVGYTAPNGIPTGAPTVGVRALAENIERLPETMRRHVAGIVEEYLRAAGHLPPAEELPAVGPLGDVFEIGDFGAGPEPAREERPAGS